MDIKVAKILSVFLWLVALHSFLVGLGLILLPSSAFEYLGFNSTFDRFFSTQGGVFHIAMSVGYSLAAYDIKRYKALVLFSVIIKLIAAVFLFLYFVLMSSKLLIIASGISDLIMGICIVLLFRIAATKNNLFSKVS